MRKRIFKLMILDIFLLLLLVAGIIAYLFFSPINKIKLNSVHRRVVHYINNNWNGYLNALPEKERKIASYENLMYSLNFWERNFAKRVFAINPKEIGFLGPNFGIKPMGETKETQDKTYNYRDVEIKTGVNYLPLHVYTDYNKMNEVMFKNIGKRLDVLSGYRSPGISGQLFFYYLENENGWSLLENAKWIAMPGYSEHNSPTNTAIDFINQDGISGEDKNQTAQDFENLPEFKWLMLNAKNYNFYLTYPKGNPFGVEYEPWHWHWEIK